MPEPRADLDHPDAGRVRTGAARFVRSTIRELARRVRPAIDELDPSLLDRKRLVRCYHCGKWHEAPGRSINTACPHCYRQLSVQDIRVRTTTWGGTMVTCGSLSVERYGRVQARLIVACEGATIEGAIEATLISGGPVRLGPFAVVRGGIRAPAMTVEPGAVMIGARVEVPHDSIGLFDINEAARFGVVRGSVSLERARELKRL